MSQIHIVPHTHWDREWYLPFQVFRIKLVHLMDRLLGILRKDTEFTDFMLDGQAILLEDYGEIRPEMFETIREFVQAGRLHIGPWYVLPDEFIVSPEALIRNLLIGRQVCADYGSGMQIGYIPDPFGHIGQLPQILNGFGITRAAFRRGLSEEPVELYWDAAADSRILISYLRDGYDNAARAPEDPDAFRDFIRAASESLKPHVRSSHILLLNGTDHHEPQDGIPGLIEAHKIGEDEVKLSNLSDYFEAVEDEIRESNLDIPVIQGELRDPQRHHLLSGTLSSRIWLKQRNHRCETQLERWAEPFTAWANLYSANLPDRSMWTGHLATPFIQQPNALLKQAWRLLLTCHPHDSICGCSIDQVHKEMEIRFDMVEQIARECTRQSLQLLAERVETTSFDAFGCQAVLTVFNADPSEKTGPVSASLELSAGLDPFEIVDENNKTLDFRMIQKSARSLADLELDGESLTGMLSFVKSGEVMGLAIQDVAVVDHEGYTLIDVTVAQSAEPNTNLVQKMLPEIKSRIRNGEKDRYQLIARFATEVEIEFLASEVPALGYKTYGLRPARFAVQEPAHENALSIRNEYLDLQLNLEGALDIHDLRTGKRFHNLLKLYDQAECGDSYSFCGLENDQSTPIDIKLGGTTCTRDTSGSTLIYELEFDLPEKLNPDRSGRSSSTKRHSASIEATLLQGIPRVDLKIRILNKSSDHRLQAVFPTRLPAEHAIFDGHFELVERNTRLPESDRSWAERPVIEQPVRRFVAVGVGDNGLMVANRGLREASVDPNGEIRITLLRAFGWLSRDDLTTRAGGAGPSIATPGGQGLRNHTFHLALIPIASDFLDAVRLADQFQTKMIGVGSALGNASAPPRCSLVTVDEKSFQVTAVKIPEEGAGIVLRGYNSSQGETHITLRFGIPIRSADWLRLDETVIEALTVLDHSWIQFDLEPGEIVTLKIQPEFPHVG